MKNCNAAIKKFQRKEVKLSDDARTDIKKKADSNRKRLKSRLAESERPMPVGMQTQGSYAMKTMIQQANGDYDIDDGVYFKKADLVGPRGGEMSALQVREMICDALYDARYNDPPEIRKNCVRVYYKDGYHIDVPAYRQVEIVDPIHGTTKKAWELASSGWKASDALAVTKWFKTANKLKSSDASEDGNRGQFVRITRLMKKFARSRASWSDKMTSGFAISALVEETFLEVEDRDDQALRETMQKIHDRLLYNDEIKHPTLHGENIVDSGNTKVTFLKEKLSDNLAHLEVLDDPNCDHETAMAAWNKVFNTDWFSDEPDPEDEKKLDKKLGSPVVKAGTARYA